MSEKLKPCPFCGYDDTQVSDEQNGFEFGWCPECGSVGPTHPTQAEAITAWNTRAGEKA